MNLINASIMNIGLNFTILASAVVPFVFIDYGFIGAFWLTLLNSVLAVMVLIKVEDIRSSIIHSKPLSTMIINILVSTLSGTIAHTIYLINEMGGLLS